MAGWPTSTSWPGGTALPPENAWPTGTSWPVDSLGTPLTIITSSPPKLWVDSQLGAGANAWVDQTANGNNFTEATNPPVLGSTGGVPSYLFNGTNQQFLSNNLTITAGQWYWVIARPIAWVANASLCGGKVSADATIFATGSSPEVSMFSGVTGGANSAGVPGSWYRYKWLTTGTGADYLQIGATRSSGTGGANAETGWYIGCRAGTAFGNYAIAAIVACAAEPSTNEKTALDNYGAARWPSVAFGGLA